MIFSSVAHVHKPDFFLSPLERHLQAPNLAIEHILVAVIGRLRTALVVKHAPSVLQKRLLPLPNHHGMHLKLLPDLIDRHQATHRLECHFCLEIGAV